MKVKRCAGKESREGELHRGRSGGFGWRNPEAWLGGMASDERTMSPACSKMGKELFRPKDSQVFRSFGG